jgi:uncharacterized SAM-dependent methyltransferase
MTELAEIKQAIDHQNKKIDKLTLAITGDSDLNINGVVGTLKEHASVINKYKNDRTKMLLIGSGMGAVFGGIVTYWKEFFHK